MKRSRKYVGLDVHQATTVTRVRNDSGRGRARKRMARMPTNSPTCSGAAGFGATGRAEAGRGNADGREQLGDEEVLVVVVEQSLGDRASDQVGILTNGIEQPPELRGLETMRHDKRILCRDNGGDEERTCKGSSQ
jgi:hypothetical protein